MFYVYILKSKFDNKLYIGFTSNLEKGQRGYQCSIHSAGINLGMGLTAFFGAMIAQSFNFRIVFLITGCTSLIGLLILFKLEKEKLKKI